MRIWLCVSLLVTALADYHPLNPLTPQEAVNALALLSSNSAPTGGFYLDKGDRISSFYEKDPPKSAVLTWQPGSTLPRQVFVDIMKPSGAFTGIVDLDAKLVKGWRKIDVVKEGGPSIDNLEFLLGPALVFSDPTFVAGLTRRGLKQSDVNCLPLSWGGQWNASFAKEESMGVRLLHVVCLVTTNSTNPWYRPVPFLSAVVDTTNKQVLRVYDRADNPPVPVSNDYDEAACDKLKPFPKLNSVSMSQPAGPSYSINGNVVNWQSWKFHVKPHSRAGMVLSQVSFLDPRAKVYRSVLYQLHPTELFVPYQTPDLDYANRAYEDEGEYGFGILTTTMLLPSDCPPHANFFNGTIVAGNGSVVSLPQALCIFERQGPVQAWRHTEVAYSSARGQVELVLRMIPTVGNYDYIVDIVLRADASISVQVTATGIIEIQPSSAASVPTGDRFGIDPYGTLVSPGHVGSFHDHFFCFRVDMDVDGDSPNRFVKEQLVKTRLPENNPVGRKSLWQVKENLVANEADAKSIPDVRSPDVWSFRHSKKTSNVNNPVGYKLVPGAVAVSLMDDDDPPQKRGRFSKYPLWVTPQSDDEIWASGTRVYDTNGESDGLDYWTSANRSLVDQDLVAWYTIGIHHVVRQEDGPVMPSLTQSFEFVPENFFQDNPALVIPSSL